MTAFIDLSPDTLGVGNKYRMVPLWGPKSVHSRGAPQFTGFRKFRRPRFTFDLAWTQLEKPIAQEIDRHVRAQLATVFPFDWFDWYSWWWQSVLVGVGNGVTVQWVLPAKDVTDVTIYTGGATLAGGANDRQLIGGNIEYRIGPNLEDGVTLFSPPPAGRPIWAYFRGRRRWNVTIESDLQQALSRDLDTGLYSVPMRIIQTKPTVTA